MKKRLMLAAALLVSGTLFVNAQGGGGGFQRRTVEERIAMIHHIMDSAFKFEAPRQAKIDSVFAGFYRSTDKAREELMAGGGDRSAMREKMQPYMDARDKDLQGLMGDDKYKIWKEQIEPSLRRGPGGPPPPRQ